MVALGCNGPNPLEKFASVIKADGGFARIQVIGKAKVPIIKFEDSASGTPLNVCFGQEDGLTNSMLVKELVEYYPAMRPLILVLKQFLYNRDLHETYTGGIGSYLLAMTVVSMLQNHPGRGPDHKEGEGNLGALLLDYLQLYGIRFNYDRIGPCVLSVIANCVVVRSVRTYFSMFACVLGFAVVQEGIGFQHLCVLACTCSL